MNNPRTIDKPAGDMLSLLQAAHAVVCTFSVDNESGDSALSYPAIVKMLKGVDVLLEQAQRSDDYPGAKIHNSDWIGADDLPELWMFRSAQVSTMNTDMMSTVCCRAQGVIRLMIDTGNDQGWFEKSHEHVVSNSIWAIEGMIAQAISTVTMAMPAEPLRAAA